MVCETPFSGSPARARLTVAVHDTPENILERITFYDIDSRRINKHLTEEERSCT